MSTTRTEIAWTDRTWNPTRGCSRVSLGCGGPKKVGGCYAEKVAYRFSGPGLPYEGLARMTENGPRWTGVVRLVPELLDEPLRWRRGVNECPSCDGKGKAKGPDYCAACQGEPTRSLRIFVNSMSDLFHEALSNEEIEKVFGVMALAPQHTFQVLTKRPARMREWFSSGMPGLETREEDVQRYAEWRGKVVFDSRGSDRHKYPPRAGDVSNRRVWPGWPLPNVWLGVSVEDQATADQRIPLLLQTPAAVRFISLEPQLGHVDLFPWLSGHKGFSLDQVIQGGESGPGARPFRVEWARAVRDQCRAGKVAYFLKQLGSVPTFNLKLEGWPEHVEFRQDTRATNIVRLRDRKGGDMSEWSPDLRVREFPA